MIPFDLMESQHYCDANRNIMVLVSSRFQIDLCFTAAVCDTGNIVNKLKTKLQ